MDSLRKAIFSRERAAALIIVLAFVVLLTGLVVAYLSRTTGDRQVAHASFNQSKVDQLAISAMDNIIGDLRQEIINGSTATTINSVTVYAPTSAANMLPQRSGTSDLMPNLIRRSIRPPDPISAPGLPSRASAVNSTTDLSANGRFVTLLSWNKHYLIPRPGGASADDTTPISGGSGFTAPDWVFVSNTGAATITAPNSSIIGRYAYAIYDEGGLLDANVAGYPSNTTVTQSGRKGSQAFADLTSLGVTQSPGVDNIVGFRNYASAQPSGNFGSNFTFTAASATLYYNYVLANNTGFLTVNPQPTPSPATLASRTDQMFVNRQELINFCRATSGGMFTANALQYLGTFSRETNSPSFSPTTPTAVNPNFLLAQVTTSFTRFDGTTANVGEPLVKRRFPLSRLAWITYKGPSADVYNSNPNDPVIIALLNSGVPLSTIQAGTAANIKACFGLTFSPTP